MKWTNSAKKKSSKIDCEKSSSAEMAMGAYKIQFHLINSKQFISYLSLFHIRSCVCTFFIALTSFDFDRELTKDTTIFLQFKSKELEANYVKQRESMSSVPLIASVLVHLVASIYSSFILPSSFIHFLVVVSPITLTLPLVWISVAESFPMV